ncbi:hypothetical protein [uncultured Shewanella sp.]|uniref:hypothetical protein n=1 Tax=uncultured Shewanella sp. TaxID=173975 RepID=UPI00261C8896|nr:hypothetical protein [uncultured Shewanella sp.]
MNIVRVLIFSMPLVVWADDSDLTCEANTTESIYYVSCHLGINSTPSKLTIQSILDGANSVNEGSTIALTTLSYWQAWGAKGGRSKGDGKGNNEKGGHRGYSEFFSSLESLGSKGSALAVKQEVNMLWGKNGRKTESCGLCTVGRGTGGSSTLFWVDNTQYNDDGSVKDDSPRKQDIILIAGGGGGAGKSDKGYAGGQVCQILLSDKDDTFCGKKEILAKNTDSTYVIGVYGKGKGDGGGGGALAEGGSLSGNKGEDGMGGKGGQSGGASSTTWYGADNFEFTDDYKEGKGGHSRAGGGGGFGGGANSGNGGGGGGSFAIKSVEVSEDLQAIIPYLREKNHTHGRSGSEAAMTFFPEYVTQEVSLLVVEQDK